MRYTKENLKNYDRLFSDFDVAKEKLDDRVGEIIKLIHSVFNSKLLCWWYPNAEEGEIGHLSQYKIMIFLKSQLPFPKGKGLNREDQERLVD